MEKKSMEIALKTSNQANGNQMSNISFKKCHSLLCMLCYELLIHTHGFICILVKLANAEVCR